MSDLNKPHQHEWSIIYYFLGVLICGRFSGINTPEQKRIWATHSFWWAKASVGELQSQCFDFWRGVRLSHHWSAKPRQLANPGGFKSKLYIWNVFLCLFYISVYFVKMQVHNGQYYLLIENNHQYGSWFTIAKRPNTASLNYTYHTQSNFTTQQWWTEELSSVTGNIWSRLEMTMVCATHVTFPGLPHINQIA